ncbi:MAG: hypothetical protein AAFO79_01525, partial [Pseudomonadota bacterium]
MAGSSGIHPSRSQERGLSVLPLPAPTFSQQQRTEPIAQRSIFTDYDGPALSEMGGNPTRALSKKCDKRI